MAAPQRNLHPDPPVRESAPGKRFPNKAKRRRESIRRRRFLVLVVVPVLLMLGSVYTHTVATGLGNRGAVLSEQRDELQAEREALEVEVSKLSAPDRVRSLARENLGMRAPAAEDMTVYTREDGEQDARQQIQEESGQ